MKQIQTYKVNPKTNKTKRKPTSCSLTPTNNKCVTNSKKTYTVKPPRQTPNSKPIHQTKQLATASKQTVAQLMYNQSIINKRTISNHHTKPPNNCKKKAKSKPTSINNPHKKQNNK